MMKKVWKKPELTVLVRGGLSENVLGTCRVQYQFGPVVAATGCMNATGSAACRGHSKT